MDGYADGCPQDNSSTQRTDFDLKAVNMDGNTKSRARAKMSYVCMHGYTGGHHWDKWLARSR